MAVIHGSVGRGGDNALDDVKVVQGLLAAWGMLTGPADGLCDNRTVAAIERFQVPMFRHPDGRVDVRGRTWARLAGPRQPTAPTVADDDPAPPARHPMRTITAHELTRWVSRDGQEVRFATLQGAPPPARWTHLPTRAPIPASAHQVPVLIPYRTPLVPGGFNRFSRDRVRFLDAIRATLRTAGLDWDARVLMPLWANESGWDQHNYGYNVGNIKAQGTVYSPSFDHLVRTRTVHVVPPESKAVMVFADRWRSIDGYHAFATPAAYACYAARLLDHYPGAIAALRLGGEEGVERFARALQGGRRRYSPANVETAVREFRGSYRRSHALIGDELYLP